MDHQEAPAASHSDSTNTALLRKLSAAVTGHAATATFACGGSVPLNGNSKDKVPRDVTVRWDPNDYRDHHKISFPLPENDTALARLVQHCQPATFGLGGRDVLDEDYRKASKLDSTAFSTNFHPHDCGIVDAVQQILMPSTLSQNESAGPHGVRVELYKLNIYSAPSGKFLSHVDTPRGLTQFGSLVVCLPCAHEGGTLRVKHRNQTIDFAWGEPDPKSVHWAAFYGDCTHEVLEVTSGHRVTLTYNLYSISIGNFGRPLSDPTNLPLYNIMADMLHDPQFMRKGGYIGFFCHHAYAHSAESEHERISGKLKGVDLAVYSAFCALALEVSIRPVLHKTADSSGHKLRVPYGGLSVKKLFAGSKKTRPADNVDFVEDHLDAMVVPTKMDKEDAEFDRRNRERIQDTRQTPGSLEGWVLSEWESENIPQIIWMNEAEHEEFAWAGIAPVTADGLTDQTQSTVGGEKPDLNAVTEDLEQDVEASKA
ncbi:MAG: hypothetical protein Q9209_002361 [Squamulea sp. 1 TL-2023]